MLEANRAFEAWGRLVQEHDLDELSKHLPQCTPSVSTEKVLESITLVWGQNPRQIGTTIALTFSGRGPVHLRWGSFDDTVCPRDRPRISGIEADGASATYRGKTLEFSIYHDNERNDRKLAERCTWFPDLNELLLEKPKMGGLVVGRGRAYGLVHRMSYALDSAKEERMWKRLGYRLTLPDMTEVSVDDYPNHILLPSNVTYRRSPTDVADRGEFNRGYRGPKFR